MDLLKITNLLKLFGLLHVYYICEETNTCAKDKLWKPMKSDLNRQEGWFGICLIELKGFLSILVYMGLQKLP